jgi:hypothetical protein
MSSVQAPLAVCIPYPAREEPVLSGAEFLHLDAFFGRGRGIFLEEENAMARKRAESVAQYELPVYQAAAVVVRTALP